MIRFLHAADFHLGMRVTRFDMHACNRIIEARFEAIEQLRAKAVEHDVQFILIAGDMFDDHSVSSVIAERGFTLFEGRVVECPVYVIAGNHDPLSAGGVWDRGPWGRDQPTKHLRLLREAAPVNIPGLPVTLFPCPLRNRRSVDDPTRWISAHPRQNGDQTIRIGLAHGSLGIMPNLPLDDHLIRPDAASYYGLDYLALGHWHKPFLHPGEDGGCRTAYCGTHEPMRFPDLGASLSTGWSSFSADGDAERFQDNGKGTALLVSIEEAGAVPKIEVMEVGRLRWSAEQWDLTSKPMGELISHYADLEQRALTVLRLRLTGVVSPRQHRRIHEVLREIVCNRYCAGSSLDADDVLIEPSADELNDLVGDGVLARVLQRLRGETESTDPSVKRVAHHALKLFYKIAWAEQVE